MNQYYNHENENGEYQNNRIIYAEVKTVDSVKETPASSFSKKTIALMMCACLILSTAAGFGGGYMAGNMNNSNTTQAPPIEESETNILSSKATPVSNGEAMTVSQVAEAVSETVVEIAVETKINGFMQSGTSLAKGSGVIISENGYIITNNHVINGGTTIEVRLQNGETYEAELVAGDFKTDVAIIKIDAEGLKAAPIGSSAERVIGDSVVAIGNPKSFSGTVTDGIISGTSREVEVDGQTMKLLQTNAAVNSGNSGGGLFNDRGELVGIVVAKSLGIDIEGIGFAIPIDSAKGVAEDLIDHGYVKGRGELGVTVKEITSPEQMFSHGVSKPGVYIFSVEPDAGADIAGIKIGDRIVSINGEEMLTTGEMIKAIEEHGAGDSLEMIIVREGEKMEINVILQEAIPEYVTEVPSET